MRGKGGMRTGRAGCNPSAEQAVGRRCRLWQSSDTGLCVRIEHVAICNGRRRAAGGQHPGGPRRHQAHVVSSCARRTLYLTVLLPLLVSVMVWLALVWKLFSNRTTGASVAGVSATVGSAVRSSYRGRSAWSVRLLSPVPC